MHSRCFRLSTATPDAANMCVRVFGAWMFFYFNILVALRLRFIPLKISASVVEFKMSQKLYVNGLHRQHATDAPELAKWKRMNGPFAIPNGSNKSRTTFLSPPPIPLLFSVASWFNNLMQKECTFMCRLGHPSSAISDYTLSCKSFHMQIACKKW